MRIWIFFVFAALLLGPLSAAAQVAQGGSWQLGCETTVTGTQGARGGFLYCYTPAAGADDEVATPILDVTQCENVDYFLFDDYDGDATVCTVTWNAQMCPPRASSLATNTLKNASCADIPGAVDLTADDVESNIAVKHLRFHGNNAGANITSCQIVVSCAEEASK